MKRGRPISIRVKKQYKRKWMSAARKGAGNAKQKSATQGRNRKRRRRR